MSLTDTFKTSPQTTLKNLIQILHDGEEGFKHASENVKSSSLKATFSGYSAQRSKFAGEIERELAALGEDDAHEQGTTVVGSLHRSWIDLKAAMTHNSDHAVLAEAERGEDAAKKEYKEALEQELPAPLREIISAQAAQVQQAHDEVKLLRDSTKE